MTDTILQKVEDKILALLTELETLRQEVGHLRSENAHLKIAHESNYNKLQNLVSLLDVLEPVKPNINANFEAIK